MVAFTDGGATVQPSIGDDSDEDKPDTVQQVDQELIQPLMNIAEEAAGCVSTIEERLRITRSNKSNQSSSNGTSGGGGSWVFASENKNTLYEAIDCPKSCVNIVPIVPNICADYVVLNNSGTTLSNSSSVGVSNDSVTFSKSNVDTSTCNKPMSSNSGEVVAVGNIPPSGQSSNVAQATGGINNSSNSNGKSLAVKPTNNFSETRCILQDESARSTSENSCVATNNCVNINESRDSLTRNALSNSIEKGEHDFNSKHFWGVGNEPLSPPAAMPAHIHTGWEGVEENSQNSQDS
ncbi:unnamed protein product, partial [Rotaria magnacalcarata]